MLLQVFYQCSYGRSLLTNSNIDTVNRISCLIEALLVDDGINGDSSLTCLAVADNQLTLSTTDRNHRVDSLQARLQRFLYRLTIDNARSLAVKRHFKSACQVEVALPIDSLTQRIDDTSEHIVVHADAGNTLCTFYAHAFLDARC